MPNQWDFGNSFIGAYNAARERKLAEEAQNALNDYRNKQIVQEGRRIGEMIAARQQQNQQFLMNLGAENQRFGVQVGLKREEMGREDARFNRDITERGRQFDARIGLDRDMFNTSKEQWRESFDENKRQFGVNAGLRRLESDRSYSLGLWNASNQGSYYEALTRKSDAEVNAINAGLQAQREATDASGSIRTGGRFDPEQLPRSYSAAETLEGFLTGKYSYFGSRADRREPASNEYVVGYLAQQQSDISALRQRSPMAQQLVRQSEGLGKMAEIGSAIQSIEGSGLPDKLKKQYIQSLDNTFRFWHPQGLSFTENMKMNQAQE